MVNRLVVFFCHHDVNKEVEIKGVYDMDFFETPQALKFINHDGELIEEIPSNPYTIQAEYTNWKCYQDLVAAITSDEEFEELLSECIDGIETYHRKGYNVEMEALKWQ